MDKDTKELIRQIKAKRAFNNFKSFKNALMNLKPNEKLVCPAGFYFKWLEFDMDKNGFEYDIEYSWSAEYNYKSSGQVGYKYPMKSANLCKVFKTEAGAKRNLIEKMKWYFEQYKNKC